MNGGGGGMSMGGMGAGFGQIIDAFGNMAKAHDQNALGLKQQNQANNLAGVSATTVSPALQKEFQEALQTKREMAANGLPDINAYNDQLDKHLADSIAVARNAGGSGDSLLATLSSLGKSNDNSHLSLDEQDAQTREGNMNDLVNTLWQVGAEKDNNDVIKRGIQAKFNAQSGALSNAATSNEYQAKGKSTDATTGMAAGVVNLAMSAAGGSGGAKGTTGGSGPAATGQVSAPAANGAGGSTGGSGTPNVSTNTPDTGDMGNYDGMSVGMG